MTSRLTDEQIIEMLNRQPYMAISDHGAVETDVGDLIAFARAIERYVLSAYPDKDGNADMHVMGHYVGRGKIVEFNFGKIDWGKK